MRPDGSLIHIRTSKLTLGQVMETVAILQEAHPDFDIYMDGDEYAIVGDYRGETA